MCVFDRGLEPFGVVRGPRRGSSSSAMSHGVPGLKTRIRDPLILNAGTPFWMVVNGEHELRSHFQRKHPV